MHNKTAIADFQAARTLFGGHLFAEASVTMQRYRQAVDYNQFEQTDKRTANARPELSVVIVSFNTGEALLDCIRSVFEQKDASFEIILIDQGGNENINEDLSKLPLLWIKPPINLFPSEGRNVGAHFACGEVLVFLDDDALMDNGYLAEAKDVMADEKIIALRGRVFPKSISSANPPVKLYDLGETPKPGELNLEGNMVIRHSAFKTVGGFDPLMFGHEGKELTRRCRAIFPEKMIYYWPTLKIRHDYASEGRLAAKWERQALGSDYIEFLKEESMNSGGVSIIIRPGSDLSAIEQFLASFSMHNTYKPVEILLTANSPSKALSVIRPYLPNFFIRILPASISKISLVANKLQYENVLIVDLPADIQVDMLRMLKYPSSSLLCKRSKLKLLSNATINTRLYNISLELDQTIGGENQREEADKPVNSQGNSNYITSFEIPESTDLFPSISNNISFACIEDNTEYINLFNCHDKAGRPNVRERIVAGMATIPERVETLPEVIERLLPQFDEVCVFLNGHEKVPACVKQPKVCFAWSKNSYDYAAAAKFYFLDRARGGYYFSLDDDFLYPPDYVYQMVLTLKKYGDHIPVCVHGSLMGSPLEWYFERTKVFGSRQFLKHDRFVTLVGTGTAAFHTDRFNIKFIDFLPHIMCDARFSVNARVNKIPIISVARPKDWLRTIENDKVMSTGNDYWTRMVVNDDGRTFLMQQFDWSFKEYSNLIASFISRLYDNISTDELNEHSFDVELLSSIQNGTIPQFWDTNKSRLFYLRKYQYYRKEYLLRRTNGDEFSDTLSRESILKDEGLSIEAMQEKIERLR